MQIKEFKDFDIPEVTSLKFYRHKEFKSMYLCFFDHYQMAEITYDILDAIKCYENVKRYISVPALIKKSEFSIHEYKHFDIDGYSGNLTKIIDIKIEDFEEVTFVENRSELNEGE